MYMYRIAGNFRGRKLLQISQFCGYIFVKVFSVKFGGMAPLALQKQAIRESFLRQNVFSPICQSFLPQKFLLAVACYSTLKSDTDIWKHFYVVCHHSSATCATLKCTSEASELKTDLWKAEAKLHKLAFSEKCTQCMHARGLLCLWAKLSATSVQIFAFWFSKNSSNLHQSCATNVCLNLSFLVKCYITLLHPSLWCN